MNDVLLSTDHTLRDPKLLSIVIAARNDRYFGNYIYRLSTTINHMARNLSSLGRLDDVELIVIDWASDVPLAQAVSVSEEGARLCRFVFIPLSIASKESPQGRLHGSKALNAGLRRTNGAFAMICGGDTVFPRHSVRAILELLDGSIDSPFCVERTLFFLNRYEIPAETMEHEPSLSALETYLWLSAGSLEKGKELPGLGLAGSSHLMHRSLWTNFRGYDETASGWGWSDAELCLRVTQLSPWVDLSCIGVSAYHLGHWPSNPKPGLWSVPLNPHTVNLGSVVNGEDWGLGDANLEVQKAHNPKVASALSSASDSNGPAAARNCTLRGLIDELTSDRVVAHAGKISKRESLSIEDWESLCIVCWFGLYHAPRVYLHLGIRHPYAAIAAGSASPGAAIYGIDSWQPRAEEEQVFSLVYVCHLLRKAGHRGYVRFMTGGERTALRRLQESFVGDFLFDLVHFRGDVCGRADTVELLEEILPFLAPHGLLVLSSESRSEFSHVWTTAQKRFDGFTYVPCFSGRTGLILGPSWQGDPSDIPEGIVEMKKEPIVAKNDALTLARKIWSRLWDYRRNRSV